MEPWRIKTYEAFISYLDDLPPDINKSAAAADILEGKIRLPPLPDMIIEWSFSCVILGCLHLALSAGIISFYASRNQLWLVRARDADGLWILNLRAALLFGSMAQAASAAAFETFFVLTARGSLPYTWLPAALFQHSMFLWPCFCFYVHGVTCHFYICRQTLDGELPFRRWVIYALNAFLAIIVVSVCVIKTVVVWISGSCFARAVDIAESLTSSLRGDTGIDGLASPDETREFFRLVARSQHLLRAIEAFLLGFAAFLAVIFLPLFILHVRMLVATLSIRFKSKTTPTTRPHSRSLNLGSLARQPRGAAMDIRQDSVALLSFVTVQYLLSSLLIAFLAAAVFFDFDDPRLYKMHFFLFAPAEMMEGLLLDVLFLWPPLYRWLERQEGPWPSFRVKPPGSGGSSPTGSTELTTQSARHPLEDEAARMIWQ